MFISFYVYIQNVIYARSVCRGPVVTHFNRTDLFEATHIYTGFYALLYLPPKFFIFFPVLYYISASFSLY